ncbi:MAG: SIS domain-containing protein [Chitinophagaceae bacterium]|nr:MAG: SIS domain-containing protein [Chitinophagaceae bacterium]
MDKVKLDRARQILEHESKAILNIPIDNSLIKSVEIILGCKGKVVLSGMGKAGLIARKIAATLSSTGTPSMYLHPGEAQHGDLGALRYGDVLIILSNSGKTREALELVSLSRELIPEGISIIVITSNTDSPLTKVADVTLSIGNATEACFLGMAPTTSTTCMLAVGDVLSLLVMEEKKFTKSDFAKRHHGGYLGEKSKD